MWMEKSSRKVLTGYNTYTLAVQELDWSGRRDSNPHGISAASLEG